MLFVVSSLKGNGLVEDFTFQLATLDEGLDFVSRLATTGNALVEVVLIDENGLTILPKEVFDGTNFSGPLNQLKADWNAILTPPVTGQIKPASGEKSGIGQCETDLVEQEPLPALARHRPDIVLVNRQVVTSFEQRLLQPYLALLRMIKKQLERTYALRSRFQRRFR